MKHRLAFTLVENVLAFTILALGLAAAIAMTQSGFFLSSATQHGIQSEAILSEMLEMYSQDYTRYAVDQTYVLDPVVGGDDISYGRKVTFSTYSSDPVAPIRQVSVTTSWRSRLKTYQRTRTRLLCRVGR